MPVSSVTEHWIKQDALTINLNHFGDPDYLQVSVLAGAVVMAFKQDVIGYNAAHNYRTWPLQAANTYLETSSAVNVYARLTRSEVNASALIVYDPVLRDIEGREISYAEDGSELLGDSDPAFFYVFVGQMTESLDSNGNKKPRDWNRPIIYGTLDSSEQKNYAGLLWEMMFTPHFDDPLNPDELTWIEAKKHIGVVGGISMFVNNGKVNLPSIYDGLPIDRDTIYWENGVLKAKVGGDTGGVDEDAVRTLIESYDYATKDFVRDYVLQNATGGEFELSKQMVIDALGFTPYSAENPNGYITAASIPSALKNPYALTFGSKTYDGSAAKSITASDLGAALSSDLSKYLPLTGGTINASGIPLTINRTGYNVSAITFSVNGTEVGRIGVADDSTPRFLKPTDSTWYNIWHAGNFNPANYLPLSGGTIQVDNVGKFNIYNTAQDGSYVHFFATINSAKTDLGYIGINKDKVPSFMTSGGVSNTIWHAGNDGSGSGLDADLLDGLQPSELNVGSATKLQTPRTIWGQSFDGSGDVTGDLLLGFKRIKGNNDVWNDGTYDHTWYGLDMASGQNGVNSMTISSFFGLSLKTYKGVLCITKDEGNVGVGTTNPLSKCHIAHTNWDNGLILQRTASGAGAGIKFMDSASMLGIIGINGTKTLEVNLSKDGSTNVNRLTISNTGTMELKSENAPSFTITRTVSNGGAFIAYYHNNQSTKYWQVGAESNETFGFRYSNNPEMILNSTGGLTLGNSDLAGTNYRLYVNGKAYLGGATTIGGNLVPSASNTYALGASNNNWSYIYTTGIRRWDGSTANEAPLLHGESNNTNLTLLRVSYATEAKFAQTGAYGFTLKYFGVGGGNANYLKLLADNQTASSQVLALCVDQAGNIGVGCDTNEDYKLRVNGTGYFSSNILVAGGVTMQSARILKNVVDERGLSLAELSKIKPTRYTWKDKRDDRLHFGGIADDIEKVLPEVIYTTSDGTLTMDYGNAGFAIASSLIKPVVDHETKIIVHDTKIIDHETEIRLLKMEVKELKERLNRYEA